MMHALELYQYSSLCCRSLRGRTVSESFSSSHHVLLFGPRKRPLISISFPFICPWHSVQLCFLCGFLWLEKVYLECTTITNTIKGCYERCNTRAGLLSGHREQKLLWLKCALPPMTRCADGTFSRLCFLKRFSSNQHVMFSVQKGNTGGSDASRTEEMHAAFKTISVKH